MRFRLMKFSFTAAHLVTLWLTFKLLTGQLDWSLASGVIGIAGFWLLVTSLRLRSLFATYFDTLSRLQVLVPMNISLALTAIVFFCDVHTTYKVVAAAEFLAWGAVYFAYRRNRENYKKQGHGPLPLSSWVNPPVEALAPGDLILTSGRIAARVHESVGHGEIIVADESGRLMAFSSYMERGAVLQTAEEVCGAKFNRGHFIVLRPVQTVSAAQNSEMLALARKMLADNDAWRTAANRRRQALVNWLPLPKAARSWVFNRIRATGYDWAGLFIGTRAANRWTCIGACLELMHRAGIKTRQYGTGLLGLGTGLLNPIMPIRFLADPAFRMLSEADRKAFEANRKAR